MYIVIDPMFITAEIFKDCVMFLAMTFATSHNFWIDCYHINNPLLAVGFIIFQQLSYAMVGYFCFFTISVIWETISSFPIIHWSCIETIKQWIISPNYTDYKIYFTSFSCSYLDKYQNVLSEKDTCQIFFSSVVNG